MYSPAFHVSAELRIVGDEMPNRSNTEPEAES